MTFSLSDQIKDEFDCIDKRSMTILQHEAYFHTFSIYSYTNTATDSEKIQIFLKGLNVSLQLALTSMVVYRDFFQSTMDHVNITESIL